MLHRAADATSAVRAKLGEPDSGMTVDSKPIEDTLQQDQPKLAGPTQSGATGKRAVGRPRRLTLDAIIDAACQVGIERLELASVAQILNTGVATLYGYIKGRDHLLELVADRLATRALADNYTGTWQEVLRGHAALCFALFNSRPEIGKLVGGERPDRAADYSANILLMLERRGLSRNQSIDIYIETNQAIIGAAVMMIRCKDLADTARDANGKPLVLPKGLGDYRPTLDRIIRDTEVGLAAIDPSAR